MNKNWFKSKTLWFNLIAAGAIAIIGKELSPEVVGGIMMALNWILRTITKTNIVWKE